jgi:hypothetical protein
MGSSISSTVFFQDAGTHYIKQGERNTRQARQATGTLEDYAYTS